ncbi:MAG: YlbF family regulator [Clostridiales bacterium]|nr:YlbF family regulator [Clostridiales bacterium]
MNEVFKKTRELGEALMHSDEYVTMKAAEDRAMANAEAARTMGEYLEAKQRLEAAMQQDNPDVHEMKHLSEAMELIQTKLQAIDDISALTAARGEFTKLINQVNQVLRFIITGDMSEEDEGGCGGSCAGCKGCGMVH